MNKEISCGCQDLEKNFYHFQQIAKQVYLKKDNELIYAGELLKLKEDGRIRPFVNNNNLYIFEYNNGLEIHSIKTGERKFLDIRGVTNFIQTEEKLYLGKIVGKKIVVFDAIKCEVIETHNVSELTRIHKCDNYILLYRFHRNKSFLLDIKTSQMVELEKFDYKSGAILQIIIKDTKIIVFSLIETGKSGVFVYDMGSQVTSFYFKFSDYSCRGAHLMDIMRFEFNDLGDEEQLINFNDYAEYLYFLYRKFGFYACRYYLNSNELNADNFKFGLEEIKELLHDYRDEEIGIENKIERTIERFPKSNQEYLELINAYKDLEIKTVEILKKNINRN